MSDELKVECAVKSVAFSPDMTRLVSILEDKTVKIWDAYSGACLKTIEGNSGAESLAFSPDGLYVQIDGSNFCLNDSFDINTSNSNPDHMHNARGYVGLKQGWITYNGENILLIPQQFRPIRSAVKQNKIGAFMESGRVWICTVSHS